MTIEEVLEKIKGPEKLADPGEVDSLLFWVSGWIGDYEERLAVVDQQVAIKEDNLTEEFKTSAKAKTKLKLTPIYIEQQEIERRIRQLKAFRVNLRRRFDILTDKFR